MIKIYKVTNVDGSFVRIRAKAITFSDTQIFFYQNREKTQYISMLTRSVASIDEIK